MRRCILLLVCCFGFVTTSHAAPKRQSIRTKAETNQPDMAIHTYGGGELLSKTFNTISMLIYGNSSNGMGKTFNGILRMAVLIGGIAALCMAFTKGSFNPLIRSFAIPAMAVMILMTPRTKVYIQDHLVQATPHAQVASVRVVDNVPFFMGKIAMIMSQMSHVLTRNLESVAHGVNDAGYNWTGHIYAGHNLLGRQKCRIADSVLEDNFREFCHECVFRDLGIGLYTKDELRQAKDLLKFLEANTSNIRTMRYREGRDVSFLSCSEAMHRMNDRFQGEEGNTRDIVVGEVSNELGFLLGQKKLGENELKKLMKQHVAIDVLKQELGKSQSFAVERADLQQQSQQKILGGLGARSIVSMRNFFEATVYMVFPLMLVLALVSFGFKPILNWLQFALWVNSWSLFYVVVNFLLTSVWNFRMTSLGSGSLDLTVFTSDGLHELYGSMEALAAMAPFFVPFLSAALVFGGVQMMVHLASSLTGSGQAAASMAVTEQVSGNYSLGNVSLENTNAYNAQAMKQSYTGLLSHGSTSIESGDQSLKKVHGSGQAFITQSDTSLREGISQTDVFQRSLQQSLSASEATLQDKSRMATHSITGAATSGVGLMNAISKHIQMGSHTGIQENTSTMNAYQTLSATAEEWAHTQGISKDRAMQHLLSAGMSARLPGVLVNAQAGGESSVRVGKTAFDNTNAAERYSHSSQFQDSLQTLRNLSKGEVASILGAEDAKYHEDFAASFNMAESDMDQLKVAHSQHQALSEMQSESQSNSISFHSNLNQRFVDYVTSAYDGDASMIQEALELPSSHPSKQSLIHQFFDDEVSGSGRGFTIKEAHSGTIGETYANAENGVQGQASSHFLHNREKVNRQARGNLGFELGDIPQAVQGPNGLTEQVKEGSIQRRQEIATGQLDNQNKAKPIQRKGKRRY